MKLKQIVMASALTLAAFAPTQSMAAGIERGDASIGAYGMYMTTTGMDTLILGVSGGIFITQHIEISGDINNQYTETDFGGVTSSALTQGLSVGADYYFLTDTSWLPFAGGGINYSITENDDGATITTNDYFALMVEGGARKPLGESADLDLRLRYIKPTDDLYDPVTMLLAGLKVRF